MYSRIYDKETGYQVRFYNKHTKENIWKFCKDKKEALKKANEIDIEYHKTYKNELPKGITMDISNNRFRFHIWNSPDQQNHIISCKSLSKVIDSRNYILINTYGTI